MPRPKFTPQERDQLGAWFQRTYDAAFSWKISSSLFQQLPGVRAYYPMSAIGTAGEARDMAGNGQTYDLTLNGNPGFGYDGLAPYCQYDGTGDYHSFVDDANFDILGTETYIEAAYRGITLGGWFYVEETGTLEYLIAKRAAAGQISYYLALDAADQFTFVVSDDGTNTTAVTSVAITTFNTWYCVFGRFRPAAFVDVFVNGTEYNQATARAAAFNSNAAFTIAARDGGLGPLQGRASNAFVAMQQHSNALILSAFEQTKAMYGIK